MHLSRTNQLFLLHLPLLMQNGMCEVIWDEDNANNDAHILNRPTIPTVPSQYAPTNAEQNVKSNWDATSGDAEILNKPDLVEEIDDLEDVAILTTPVTVVSPVSGANRFGEIQIVYLNTDTE